MYKKNLLREYIKNSELRSFKGLINVRLSSELAKKYDKGLYDNYFNHLYECYLELLEMGIKFPGNAHPSLYVYIVPDENYAEYLSLPEKYNRGNGSGKPVKCYDLDGYTSAYGVSQGLCEGFSEKPTIFKRENNIHELAHIIHSPFYTRGCFISEGLAETIPLYVLNYEEIFDVHKEIVSNLDDSQILSPKEIIDSERDNTFGTTSILPEKTCSFRHSYLSSYLFVMGCLEEIVKQNNCTKIEALQHFLEFLYQSKYNNELLIFDIADMLGIDEEKLLYEKTFQKESIKSIVSNTKNSTR